MPRFKAVLFASLLLAAVPFAAHFAAPAAAQVLFTGEAKMGLAFDGEDLKAIASTRLTAKAYGTTDGGLEYGVELDLGNVQSKAFGSARPHGSVYVQGRGSQ